MMLVGPRLCQLATTLLRTVLNFHSHLMNLRTEAIHVNHIGDAKKSAVKYDYVSQWAVAYGDSVIAVRALF